MNIEFVIATQKEFTAILEMMAAFNAIEGYPFDQGRVKKNLSHLVAEPTLGKVWVINVDQKTAGYIVLTFGFSFEHNGRDAFIDELFLKEEYRQKGIGQRAMDFVEKEAFQLGVNVIHLEVESQNENGIRLYKSKGYRNNGRILLSKKVLA